MLHLAAALNVSPDDVMTALSDIGEYVPSMTKKTLEEPVVRKIYDHFGCTYLSDPVHPCSQWIRHGTDTSQPARPRKHPNPHQSSATGPYTTTTKREGVALGNPNQDVAEAWIPQAWTFYGFSDVEKEAWLDAGLRDGQVQDAIKYRDAGLTPTDLGMVVAGWSVSKRLRAGEDLYYVKRLLDTTTNTEAA